MQLKAHIHNRARAEGVPPQLLMQHYLIERLLERGTIAAMGNYRAVMAQVATDAGMLGHWAAYVRGYPYVGDMTLEETCDTIVEIMEAIGW